MKHRLAALFLTVALFCTLLAGCAPTPDVPGHGGGSSSSGSTNNGGNSESEGSNGETNAPKLQATVTAERCTINRDADGNYAVGYVFRVTNPNTAYNLKTKLSFTFTNAAGATRTDFTYTPTIAPGDTIRFVYIKSYSDWIPASASFVYVPSPADYTVPEKDQNGTMKVTRSSDLIALNVKESKSATTDFNGYSGEVHNTSNYASMVKVSLVVRKNNQIVSVNAATLTLSIPANSFKSFNIRQYKYPTYDSYEVIATPWN